MAYNVEKLTKLKALKQLAERIEADFATKKELGELSGRVDDLVTLGGEPNVITAVKVNGAAQTVTDKAVDIAVPVKVSDLTNDSGYQTEAQVSAAVAAADHPRRREFESPSNVKSASIPPPLTRSGSSTWSPRTAGTAATSSTSTWSSTARWRRWATGPWT